jgi:conjugative transposon TraN protein
MTKTIFWWLGLVIINTATTFGQVENKTLTISFNKTTSLVFPYSITSVDRGSKDVLAQKARGVENVLQVKAGRKDFQETNLTVITADGVLHQFTVSYSDAPPTQTITVASSIVQHESLILVKDVVNERDTQSDMRRINTQSVRGKVDQQAKYEMVLTLQDIFVHGNTLYYRLHIRNKSSINYNIKSIKFLVHDRKKVKRTSSQEIQIAPLHVDKTSDHINGYASSTMIYAVKKFTIPDGKALLINLFEENGGRNLSLRIDNKDILRAKVLPESQDLLTSIKQ